MTPRVGGMVALGLAVLLAGCGSFDPTVDNVAGSYAATTFTLTTEEGTVDLLDDGASVTLTLDADGTTTGRLFVPNADNGEDVDEDLAGTWALDGERVAFAQGSDTFIDELEFTASEDELTTEGTFSGETVNLVLSK